MMLNIKKIERIITSEEDGRQESLEGRKKSEICCITYDLAIFLSPGVFNIVGAIR